MCHPNGWFDWTILSAIGGGIFWGGGAYYYSLSKSLPMAVVAAGLTGTVKDFSKLAVTSGSAGLVTAVLSKDLQQYSFFKQAMMATLVVAIFGSIASYFMGAALDPQTSNDGKTVTIASRFWLVLHGIIFGSTFVSMIAVLVAVFEVALSVK